MRSGSRDDHAGGGTGAEAGLGPPGHAADVPVPPSDEDYAVTAAAADRDAAAGLRRADLVLEGGGVKGIGLLGAVVEMVGQGWTFPRVAGTSAGAIVGALVAAYVHTGHDVTELVEVMERLDYRKFRDTDLVGRLGPVGRGIDLLVHDGVYKGDYLVAWLGAELERVGVRTFADLRIEDDLGTSLLPHERYRLVVMASDVSRGQLVRLPWDYRHYGIDPDRQRVAEAVRASMSYPFFFRPVTMDVAAAAGGGRVTLIDGGMLSNFPVEIFDRSDGRPARWPTFGVKLSARPAARQVSRPVDGPLELALSCLHTLLDAHDAYHLDDLHVTERTVFVDTARVSTLDFDIDAQTQHLLYTNGRAAAASFLATRATAGHPRPGPDAESDAESDAGSGGGPDAGSGAGSDAGSRSASDARPDTDHNPDHPDQPAQPV